MSLAHSMNARKCFRENINRETLVFFHIISGKKKQVYILLFLVLFRKRIISLCQIYTQKPEDASMHKKYKKKCTKQQQHPMKGMQGFHN